MEQIVKKSEEKLATNTAPTFFGVWEQYSSIPCRTVKECILARSPTIGDLSRKYGSNAIQACIEGCIVSLRDFVNLRGAMTDSQAKTTAELAVDEFKNLTIADIILIFRRAKLGQWGEFYGRLDGQMVLGWFGKYFDERCAEAATISQAEANRLKTRDERICDSEMARRLYHEHDLQKKFLNQSGVYDDIPPFDEKNKDFYLNKK